MDILTSTAHDLDISFTTFLKNADRLLIHLGKWSNSRELLESDANSDAHVLVQFQASRFIHNYIFTTVTLDCRLHNFVSLNTALTKSVRDDLSLELRLLSEDITHRFLLCLPAYLEKHDIPILIGKVSGHLLDWRPKEKHWPGVFFDLKSLSKYKCWTPDAKAFFAQTAAVEYALGLFTKHTNRVFGVFYDLFAPTAQTVLDMLGITCVRIDPEPEGACQEG